MLVPSTVIRAALVGLPGMEVGAALSVPRSPVVNATAPVSATPALVEIAPLAASVLSEPVLGTGPRPHETWLDAMAKRADHAGLNHDDVALEEETSPVLQQNQTGPLVLGLCFKKQAQNLLNALEKPSQRDRGTVARINKMLEEAKALLESTYLQHSEMTSVLDAAWTAPTLSLMEQRLEKALAKLDEVHNSRLPDWHWRNKREALMEKMAADWRLRSKDPQYKNEWRTLAETLRNIGYAEDLKYLSACEIYISSLLRMCAEHAGHIPGGERGLYEILASVTQHKNPLVVMVNFLKALGMAPDQLEHLDLVNIAAEARLEAAKTGGFEKRKQAYEEALGIHIEYARIKKVQNRSADTLVHIDTTRLDNLLFGPVEVAEPNVEEVFDRETYALVKHVVVGKTRAKLSEIMSLRLPVWHENAILQVLKTLTREEMEYAIGRYLEWAKKQRPYEGRIDLEESSAAPSTKAETLDMGAKLLGYIADQSEDEAVLLTLQYAEAVSAIKATGVKHFGTIEHRYNEAEIALIDYLALHFLMMTSVERHILTVLDEALGTAAWVDVLTNPSFLAEAIIEIDDTLIRLEQKSLARAITAFLSGVSHFLEAAAADPAALEDLQRTLTAEPSRNIDVVLTRPHYDFRDGKIKRMTGLIKEFQWAALRRKNDPGFVWQPAATHRQFFRRLGINPDGVDTDTGTIYEAVSIKGDSFKRGSAPYNEKIQQLKRYRDVVLQDIGFKAVGLEIVGRINEAVLQDLVHVMAPVPLVVRRYSYKNVVEMTSTDANADTESQNPK